MLSLKLIRDDPNLVRRALADRHTTAPIDEILHLDADRRQLMTEAETLRARRNVVSQQIGQTKQRPPELIAEMRDVGASIKSLEARIAEVEAELDQLVLYLPNLPDPTTPVGASADENVEVRHWGTVVQFSFPPKPHWEIGENLGGISFSEGSKISGPRSWVLKGDIARLNRALISFMLDLHTGSHGYTEVYTPYLVRRDCMVGTGQLPKFADEAYAVASDDLYLIPTAEVPVTNLYREEILDGGQLPIRNVAYSSCFRREAGAAGRDTRGLIRVHQFEKVEMVKVVRPEDSPRELEALVGNAEVVLQKLGLPYRVVLLCTGDLGFAAAKTYDLEVWMPAQTREGDAEGSGRWVEISSCSDFGSFQARRANIRFRPEPKERPEYVHTLNGSGLAVGRTLAAVLETYQQADGSVRVPDVLQTYLGGQAVIRP